MGEIISFYIIVGLALLITSYISVYFPAMRRTSEMLLEALSKTKDEDTTEFLVYKSNLFTSAAYQLLTLLIYSIVVFAVYPIIAVGLLISNDKMVEGFSDGLVNGLLELNSE